MHLLRKLLRARVTRETGKTPACLSRVIDASTVFRFCSLMAKPRPPRLYDTDCDALLAAVEECRRAAVQALTRAPIQAEGTRTVRELMEVLDRLAECLTGDRERFWAKPSTTPKKR